MDETSIYPRSRYSGPCFPAQRLPHLSSVRKEKPRAYVAREDYEDEEDDDVIILAHIPSRPDQHHDDPILREEAKLQDRLRKRKLAETERMLDVQRRQKQRVEELRNARKKDEENTSLKDRIRAQVTDKLQQLENRSVNFASGLHHMGIKVDGWPNPSQEDIDKAYKKALFTFHPDRFSKLGIPKQVEAEEMFKFVNHLKNKFDTPPPS